MKKTISILLTLILIISASATIFAVSKPSKPNIRITSQNATKCVVQASWTKQTGKNISYEVEFKANSSGKNSCVKTTTSNYTSTNAFKNKKAYTVKCRVRAVETKKNKTNKSAWSAWSGTVKIPALKAKG